MLNTHFIPAAPGPFPASKHILIMHGRGDVKESFIPFVKELNLTGVSFTLVDAPNPFMFGYSWYPLPPTNPLQEVREARLQLDQLISSLSFSTEDIFLLGFSQGGAMAIEHGLLSPHNFAGVIALSPRIFLRDELLTIKKASTPIFIAHGKYDDVIPYSETKANVDQLKSAHQIVFKDYEMGHEIDIMEILDLRKWINEHL